MGAGAALALARWIEREGVQAGRYWRYGLPRHRAGGLEPEAVLGVLEEALGEAAGRVQLYRK